VSFCSAGEFHALRFGADGVPEFADEEKCLKCGICYLVCPQIKALDKELRKKFYWREPAGPYRALRSAKTTNPKVAAAATDGGVVTSLLMYALDKGLIDGAVVSRRTGLFMRESAVATTDEELIEAAGSHFDHVSPLGEVGESYTSFVPTIREVRKLRQRGLSRVAFVGTPCQVYSLRKMQMLHVVPSDVVVLTIGLFCMENFSLTQETSGVLEGKLSVPLEKIAKLNIKDDVIVTLDDGETVHVEFELLDDIARPACFACTDFANDFADISCGGLGSPDGYTTVMVRTQRGERAYNGAKQKGFIREMKFHDKEESLLHRTTQMAKIAAFAQRKRQRAADFIGRG
jgi:coenzyme F420 hydrogenase subunit beta